MGPKTMADSHGTRPARVAERIREVLMELLLAGQVKDPAVSGAVVHDVRVTNDLRHARVYVRLGEIEVDERRRERLVRGLTRASGFLRREVGSRLRIRHSPELAFFWDDTTERATRVETLLDEIRAEEGFGEPGPTEPSGGEET
jgi:ribosome-binding factor A